jgi:hypothetical protein
VDVALSLLERAGDFCGDEIWHRVAQLVTNNAGMQGYAAGQVGGGAGDQPAGRSSRRTAAAFDRR